MFGIGTYKPFGGRVRDTHCGGCLGDVQILSEHTMFTYRFIYMPPLTSLPLELGHCILTSVEKSRPSGRHCSSDAEARAELVPRFGRPDRVQTACL